ncbi:MAG: hypothetical protein EBV64_14480, partial [Oxalobacteraceae bacterium]|nr:hypothetical protein [Oxalobacteraceae bacterium]
MPATAGFTVLSSGEKLQWKGAANANGLLTAFAVKAYDGIDLSTTAVPVLVSVGIINDTPTLSSVATLTGAVEDTFREISYTELSAAADEFDVETSTLDFKIDTVSASTTLQKWDSTTSLWLPAVSGTTLLSSGEKLQWKAAAHANGVLPAFTVKAQDAGGLLSPAVQVSVSVNPVNDVPTLTTVSTLTGATEDNFLVIPYGTLASVSNIADVETPLPSFRIEGVTASTTLEKWNGSTWSAVSAGSTLLSSGESLRWKAAANDSGTLNAFTVIATDATDLSTPAVQVSVSVAAVNDIPTLTSINSLNGATEDTFFEINYATLLSAADESDVETNPLTFRVESITSGTLQKWTGSAWINATAGYTTLATGEKLQWQGDTNANGMLNAFTVKVTDGTDYSSTAVPVLINVAAVNDTPTMTTLATLTGGLEDTPREITYGELADAANETDVENPALTFRIESVTGSTTLEKWTGSSWTAVTPLSTEVSSGDKLRWQAAANAFGTLPAFTVSARDAGGSASGNLQVNVEIASVNDIPTLSTVSTLTGATEDTYFTISHTTLQNASNATDVETSPLSFRIEGITAGTLLDEGDGGSWTPVTAGTTVLISGRSLRWKAAAHAFGVLPAFTIKATDGTAVSVGTVQVNVDVASSNDIPTLTTVNTLNGAVEDTFFTITYDTLAAAANESEAALVQGLSVWGAE